MFNGSRIAKGVSIVAREQLFTRISSGDLAALDCYLTYGGNINSKDGEGLAFIHYAACHGNVALIHKLREHGADMSLFDNGSPPWKPIHYAIFHRNHEAEQALRTLGAEAPLPILKRIAIEKPRGFRGEADTAIVFGRA